MSCPAVKSVILEVQNVLSSCEVGYVRGAECLVQLWSGLCKRCRMSCPAVRFSKERHWLHVCYGRWGG
jgi:hypothetical protein